MTASVSILLAPVKRFFQYGEVMFSTLTFPPEEGAWTKRLLPR